LVTFHWSYQSATERDRYKTARALVSSWGNVSAVSNWLGVKDGYTWRSSQRELLTGEIRAQAFHSESRLHRTFTPSSQSKYINQCPGGVVWNSSRVHQPCKRSQFMLNDKLNQTDSCHGEFPSLLLHNTTLIIYLTLWCDVPLLLKRARHVRKLWEIARVRDACRRGVGVR
jgi:hypothetical protein